MKLTMMLVLFLSSTLAYANPEGRNISVEGEGIYSLAPDIVEIEFELVSTQETTSVAKKKVDCILYHFLKGLENFSVDKEKVSASSLQAEREYDYDEEGNEIVNGYMARRTLSITLKDISQLESFIDYALKKGVNAVESVNLSSSKLEEHLQKAKELAIKDAITKASKTAELFGMKLGPVYSINSGYPDQYETYEYRENVKLNASGAGFELEGKSEGQYFKAKITLEERIEVVFDLIEG